MKKLIIFILCFSVSVLSVNCLELSKIAKKEKEEKKEEKEKKKKKKKLIIESEFEPILIGALLEKPETFQEKKIKFRGKFSSFTTLALDYKPALRESKNFISICLFRPDSKIPLAELKLAYPVEEAKEDEVIQELEEDDLIEIYGKVFSSALDEPWVDIVSIKMLEKAPSKGPEKKVAKDEKVEKDKSKKKEKK